MRLSSFFLISVLLVLPYLFRSGLIQPDVAFPLQISPSYNKDAGTGTVFTFRFFIPRNNDIYNFPTQSGKGATKNQYLGIEFQDITNTFYFDFPNSVAEYQVPKPLSYFPARFQYFPDIQSLQMLYVN